MWPCDAMRWGKQALRQPRQRHPADIAVALALNERKAVLLFENVQDFAKQRFGSEAGIR
jgi:hypothetical protein